MIAIVPITDERRGDKEGAKENPFSPVPTDVLRFFVRLTGELKSLFVFLILPAGELL